MFKILELTPAQRAAFEALNPYFPGQPEMVRANATIAEHFPLFEELCDVVAYHAKNPGPEADAFFEQYDELARSCSALVVHVWFAHARKYTIPQGISEDMELFKLIHAKTVPIIIKCSDVANWPGTFDERRAKEREEYEKKRAEYLRSKSNL